MKRPVLVNPKHWSPFKSLPISVPVEEIKEIPKVLTRKEYIQKNSFFINFFSVLFIFGMGYFLYTVYLERKEIYEEYLRQLQESEHNNSF
jgi:mannose-1-phosphate guanylyltransferase